jgi:uncharacterized protein
MEIADGRNPQRSFIESYRPTGFRLGGRWIEGPVLVLAERFVAWPVAGLAAVTLASLAEIVAARPEVLILGAGARGAPADPALRRTLKAAGIALEIMATGAACRTFNLLMSESRSAAAALLPAGDA